MFTKLTNLPVIILVLVCILFTGCSKDTNSTAASLQITCKDESGNLITGASVRLYRTFDPINQVGTTLITGTDGTVTFNNLSEDIYVWVAEKDCQTNQINQLQMTLFLTGNKLNTVTDILHNAGYLKLINTTSSIDYSIRAPFFSMRTTLPANTIQVTSVRVGSYTVHGEQVANPGVGKDTVINIICGDTSVIKYP